MTDADDAVTIDIAVKVLGEVPRVRAVNPALLFDLRAIAGRLRSGSDGIRDCPSPAERREREMQYEAELRRIERQRTLFVMLSPGRPTDALRTAMLDRAADLMRRGRATEADAILEFLPSADVERVLAEIGL